MSDARRKMILPGASIGVFGGGQLGRMIVHAAQRLGYRVVIFTEEIDSPASQAANETVIGDYLDPNAVRRFAEKVDVITLEFENIHLEAVQRAAEVTLVRPGVDVLAVAQHRTREKSTLRDLGFPVTPFREVQSYHDMPNVAEQLGWPLVIKTNNWGYDGKGQRKVRSLIEANDAIELLGPEPLIAEQWVPFHCEVSVLVARSPSGKLATYPMFTNSHANHILDVTTCPASEEMMGVASRAQEIARGIAESLQVEGLLCVEFFVGHDGQVMVNELAPRPHNSGHLTIEACSTSQFEQQVRAVCNLPLGETHLLRPAAMVNLLGDVWGSSQPRFEHVFAEPNAHLHLYGKSDARSGRKMGHITMFGASATQAAERAIQIRDQIRGGGKQLF